MSLSITTASIMQVSKITLSKTPHSKTILGMMARNTTTVSIMTLSIATISIADTQHYDLIVILSRTLILSLVSLFGVIMSVILVSVVAPRFYFRKRGGGKNAPNVVLS